MGVEQMNPLVSNCPQGRAGHCQDEERNLQPKPRRPPQVRHDSRAVSKRLQTSRKILKAMHLDSAFWNRFSLAIGGSQNMDFESGACQLLGEVAQENRSCIFAAARVA